MMLKNTLSLHPSSSTTCTELIYCNSIPSRPLTLSSTLSSPFSDHIPSSNTHTTTNQVTSSRFSFNLASFFTTLLTLFLFSCYFFSVAYHWLNLYPNSLGFPLGMKFLFLNQEPDYIFTLIDQMQQFGRDHQKSLDFIHVFVSIPLFTCFVFGLWFESFLSSSHSNHYSNHHGSSNTNVFMRIGVCFLIGLQLLLSWMEKIMIMVLLEKHPFDIRIIGKNPLMRAVQDVEILNWTSKASFVLGILLMVGGFWSIYHKNKQHQHSDSYSLFNNQYESFNSPSSQKGSNFLSFAGTRFRSASSHQQCKDIL